MPNIAFHRLSSFFLIVANTQWTFQIFFIHFQIPQLKKWYILVKWDVGARTSTLMSFSDGLGPSNYHRKMEGTRPMREQLDGKLFLSGQIWHFSLWCCFCKIVSPHLYLDKRANNFASRQGKAKNTRNESTQTQLLMILLTMKISQFLFFFPFFLRHLL